MKKRLFLLSLSGILLTKLITPTVASPIMVEGPFVLKQNESQIKIHTIYVKSDKLFDKDKNKVGREGKETRINIPLEYYCGITDQLTIGAIVPYVSYTWEPNANSSQRENEISDIKLVSKYRLGERSESFFTFSLGVTVPIGLNAFERDIGTNTGRIGGGPSNGTYEIDIGSYFYKKAGKINLYSSLGYVLNFERGVIIPNIAQYSVKRGDTLYYNLGIDRPIDKQLTGGRQLTFGLELHVEKTGEVVIDSYSNTDAGTNMLFTSNSSISYLIPELEFEYTPGCMWQAAIGIPLSGKLKPATITPIIGVVYNF